MKDSIKELLPREIENENLVKLLNEFSQTIDQFVNFGTYILDWDIANLKGGDEQMPVVLLFRNLLELIDSVSILIKKSSIDPCKVILRTALETSLGLEYILKEKTIDRSMAFIFCMYKNEIKNLKKLDLNTEVGKQFASKLRKDTNLNGIAIQPPTDLGIRRREIEDLLQSPIYIKFENEYKRLNKVENNPKWYRLFEGPRNVEELCNHLGCHALYEVFYRNLSDSIHGSDVIKGKLGKSSIGNIDVFQIRFPKDAQTVTGMALVLTIRIFDMYVEKRIPQYMDDFIYWKTQKHEKFKWITSTEQIMTII